MLLDDEFELFDHSREKFHQLYAFLGLRVIIPKVNERSFFIVSRQTDRMETLRRCIAHSVRPFVSRDDNGLSTFTIDYG